VRRCRMVWMEESRRVLLNEYRSRRVECEFAVEWCVGYLDTLKYDYLGFGQFIVGV
jgi:hypothetical protein